MLSRTCLWCGLVNRPELEACAECGAVFTVPAFDHGHLVIGMRIDVSRPPVEEVAARLGRGRVVVMPDRRVAVVRRRWLSNEPWWRKPPGPEDAEAPAEAYDHIERPAAAYLRVLLAPFVLTLEAIRTVAETLAAAVDFLAGLVARFVFGRHWTVEALLDRGLRRTLTWRVKGYRRSRLAIEEIALALSVGDEDFRL